MVWARNSYPEGQHGVCRVGITWRFRASSVRAIPDLHTGRALELASVNGQSSNTLLFGPLVRLKLLVKETGKLSGQFVVLMDLQPDAARELATQLNKLADAAEQLQPSPVDPS
jgi:hypothetical protein